jgi:hypothetical protein
MAPNRDSIEEKRIQQNDIDEAEEQNINIKRMSSSARLRIAQTEWSKLFRNQPPEGRQPMSILHVNNRTNIQWGDELRNKENDVTRIYSLNLNSLALDRRGGQFGMLCGIAQEIQADVVCCQESNVVTTNSTVKSFLLHQTANQHLPRSQLQFGSTDVSFANWYKPGGTMMISTGSQLSKLKTVTIWGNGSHKHSLEATALKSQLYLPTELPLTIRMLDLPQQLHSNEAYSSKRIELL